MQKFGFTSVRAMGKVQFVKLIESNKIIIVLAF
jgi:hypothetical protein